MADASAAPSGLVGRAGAQACRRGRARRTAMTGLHRPCGRSEETQEPASGAPAVAGSRPKTFGSPF
jgi:hypothetical protein